MSEATVKPLTDAIYDALEGSDPVRELDNEQVYEVARLAAQTIEDAGTTKAIVRAWLEDAGFTPWVAQSLAYEATWDGETHRAAESTCRAVREVSS